MTDPRDVRFPVDPSPAVRSPEEALPQTARELQDRDAQLAWQFRELGRLEERFARVENSLFFRTLRRVGFNLAVYKRKLESLAANLGLEAPRQGDREYERWLALQEARTPSWHWHREQTHHWSRQPLISVCMALQNPRRDWLEGAVNSVLAQSYPCWELCICDNASPGWVADYLSSLSVTDPRVRYCLSSNTLGTSAALNSAASLSRGGYLGVMGQDDVLSPLALHYVADCVRDSPADAVYTDEDCLDSEGRRVSPSFKPDWTPELLTSCMYWGNFLAIAKPRWEELGGFRSEYDEAQDYDAALRLTDKYDLVKHVPRVLYHRRHQPVSKASARVAPSARHASGKRALTDALSRRKCVAEVTDGETPNTYAFCRRPTRPLSLSFIICSMNSKLLARCLRSLEPTFRRHNCQIIVVHHMRRSSGDDGIAELVRNYRAETIPYHDSFNFSRMNNLAAAVATGDVLLFLNDDVTSISEDWVDRFIGHLDRAEVGVVGAKLLYPSGVIQHAGVVIGIGDGAGHLGRGIFHSDLWPWLNLSRNVSAVTGACMGIRREVFAGLGEFDPAFPVNYNDIDLCLRAGQAGYQVIYESRAVLRHDECQSRVPGTRLEERFQFYKKWSALLQTPDPYYSSQLSHETEVIKLSS